MLLWCSWDVFTFRDLGIIWLFVESLLCDGGGAEFPGSKFCEDFDVSFSYLAVQAVVGRV